MHQAFKRSAVLAALLVGSAAALPASAQSAPAQSFTPTQRQEIVEILRQAMKSDPSILSDAIVALRAAQDRQRADDAESAIARNRVALAGAEGDYIAGNPHGKVTLVVFYDPRCPYCRKMMPDLDRLVQSEPDLRVVEKLIPILGPDSMLQAKAIEASARQMRYAALQHRLMSDFGSAGPDQLRRAANDQGIDLSRLNRDIADPAIEAALRSNVALAQAIGITGTPSFVIGGQLIAGAISLSDMQKLVASARPG